MRAAATHSQSIRAESGLQGLQWVTMSDETNDSSVCIQSGSNTHSTHVHVRNYNIPNLEPIMCQERTVAHFDLT